MSQPKRQIRHKQLLLLATALAFTCAFTALSTKAKLMDDRVPVVITLGSSQIEVQLPEGYPQLSRPAVMTWVKRSADAVTSYYGRFPTARVLVRVMPYSGRGFGFATADSENGGGVITIPLGDQTSQKALDKDWILTHEMVHLAFPLVYPKDRWLVEGMATYIEPLARMKAGYLTREQVWGDLVNGLPKGLPQQGDQGLGSTHSWGRTYWGGALFCLLADVEIRKATANKKGLQDALQAVDCTAGGITSDSEVEEALEIGDKNIGRNKNILQSLYQTMSHNPVAPDLTKLWADLGVKKNGALVSFDDQAPLAGIRLAIDNSFID